MCPATDAEKEIGRLTLALAEAEKKAERDYLRFVEADREEIERLREENARLREVLKPFVKTLEWNCTEADPNDFFIDQKGALRVSDLRAARAAIREGGKDEN